MGQQESYSCQHRYKFGRAADYVGEAAAAVLTVDKLLPGIPVVPDQGIAVGADLRHVRVRHGARPRNRRADLRPGRRRKDTGATATRPTDGHVAELAQVDAYASRDLRGTGTSDLGLAASAVCQREARLALWDTGAVGLDGELKVRGGAR